MRPPGRWPGRRSCPRAATDCGFVFPDDDALVQEEFERNLPFARSVAESADDPDDPETVIGIETKPFYIESEDPYKEGIPGSTSPSTTPTATRSRYRCWPSEASGR